jgi:hypothetical protein
MSKKSLKALAQAACSLGQRVVQARDNGHLPVPRPLEQDSASGPTSGALSSAVLLSQGTEALGNGTAGQPAPIVPLDQLISLVETALEAARSVGVQPKGCLPARGVGLDLPPLVRAMRKSIGECGSGQSCWHRSTSSMPLSNVRKLAIGVGTELHHLELRRTLNVDAKL